MGRVLFICSGNYYRSRYAEILFNHLAQGVGGWTAFSRGFRLSPNNLGPISIHAANACVAQGLAFDPVRFPIVLSEDDLQQASRIIGLKETEHRPMMRERFPVWEDRVEYWEIHDIDRATPELALGELERAVRQLFLETRRVSEG